MTAYLGLKIDNYLLYLARMRRVRFPPLGEFGGGVCDMSLTIDDVRLGALEVGFIFGGEYTLLANSAYE